MQIYKQIDAVQNVQKVQNDEQTVVDLGLEGVVIVFEGIVENNEIWTHGEFQEHNAD